MGDLICTPFNLFKCQTLQRIIIYEIITDIIQHAFTYPTRYKSTVVVEKVKRFSSMRDIGFDPHLRVCSVCVNLKKKKIDSHTQVNVSTLLT